MEIKVAAERNSVINVSDRKQYTKSINKVGDVVLFKSIMQ